MGKILLAAGALLATAASEAAPIPGTEKLLEALAKHDRPEALRRVLSIESLSGRKQPVATPAEFIDRIVDCKITKTERKSGFLPNTQVDWLCNDGKYRAWVFEDKSGPYVVIAEFWDPKRMAAEFDGEGKMRPIRLAPPPPIIPSTSNPPPPPPAPIDTTVLNAFGVAMSGGNTAGMASSISPNVKVVLGRRDVAHQVTRVEDQGEGPEALTRALAAGRSKVGKQLVASCEDKGPFGSCVLKDEAAGQILIAMVWMHGSVIDRVDFLYANRQSVMEDASD